MSSCGKNENPQEMNRRKFLKVFGGGAVASSAALYGCAPKNEPGAHSTYITCGSRVRT